MKVINLKEAGAAIPDLYPYETVARVNDHTFTLVRVKKGGTLSPESAGGSYKEDS
ncbi:MAG: hypothetical protein K9N21_19895 [Deltaproteobacteria bacterium]|nr:hypothetical protein [Deltaproteobacteria bacterium]